MTDVGRVVDSLNEQIPRLLAKHDLPGLAVGICDASGGLWSAGFGTIRRGGNQPITTATTFSVQSATKMYTATAVMLAVQEGLVDLDAPVTRYLPEFTVHSRWEPRPEQRITPRHLLSHTAGLTHEAPLGGNLDDRDSSFEEHCRTISDTWLRFPVGHHFEYSNLGIDLAAHMLQRVHDEPFPEVLRRTLLEPLGLDRTTCDHAAIVADPDRAIGHWHVVEDVPVAVPMVGAGGLYTSVNDALRYLQFHLSGGAGLLATDLVEQMYQVPGRLPGQRFGYGLGVDLSLAGHGFRNHGGGGFGFLADLAWDPETGIGVVILTNSMDHPLQARLATQLLVQLAGAAGQPDPVPPVTTPVDAETARRLTGQYVGRGGAVAQVAFEAGRLSMIRHGKEQTVQRIGTDEVITDDDKRERFKFISADGADRAMYLVCVDDGFTRYRNEAPRLEDATVQRYAIDCRGTKAATLTLRRHNDLATLEGKGLWLTFPPLNLTEHTPGVYFDSLGETLNLCSEPPTYANIPLRPEPHRAAATQLSWPATGQARL